MKRIVAQVLIVAVFSWLAVGSGYLIGHYRHGPLDSPLRPSTTVGNFEFDTLLILRRNVCLWGASSVSAYVDGAGQMHGGPAETSGCIP